MKFISVVFLTFSAALAFAEIGLREYANDFKIGLALNSTFWEGVEGYTEAARNIFNIGVAENGCKLSHIQAEKGVYDFSQCDSHLAKAIENNMDFRGHCLIWHNYQPEWFVNSKDDDLRNAIVEHITTVLNHYRGKIDTWDVVNETVDNDSTGENGGWEMRKSFLYNEVPDFVDLAFKTAREIDPTVKLYYNDYNNEGSPEKKGKSIAVYNFVKDMVERGVPIDGVGIQYHIKTYSYPAYEDVMEIMAKYAQLGLEVQITEMDVRCDNNTKEEFEKQADLYGVALRACLDSPNCNAFLIWGLADNLSWKVGSYPDILDDDLKPKPAYYTLLNILKEYNDVQELDSGNETDVDINVDIGSGEVEIETDSDSE